MWGEGGPRKLCGRLEIQKMFVGVVLGERFFRKHGIKVTVEGKRAKVSKE